MNNTPALTLQDDLDKFSTNIEVICIAGLARAGKDTIASKLIHQFGYTPEKFAKPLYAMLVAMYDGILPLSIATIEDLKTVQMPGTVKERDVTFRFGLQTLGTEWGRDKIAHDIWPTLCVERIITLYNTLGVDRFVIADCRFANEWNIIKKAFATAELWAVKRLQPGEPQMPHRSEKGFYDLYCIANKQFENNEGIDELNQQVISTMVGRPEVS